MNENIRKAYAEVYEILKFIDKEYIDKLPANLLENIEKEKNPEHTIIVDPNLPLENQNLLEDTINILAMMKLNYWCDSEEEKIELLKILNQNEINYQEELKEKYNPDNLFKNRQTGQEGVQIEDAQKENSLTVVKNQNFIQKLFERIKNIFKKH